MRRRLAEAGLHSLLMVALGLLLGVLGAALPDGWLLALGCLAAAVALVLGRRWATSAGHRWDLG